MCVCVCVCVCVWCMCVCACVCVCVWLFCRSLCVHVRVCVWLFCGSLCVRVHVCVWLFWRSLCVHVCVVILWESVCSCACVCMVISWESVCSCACACVCGYFVGVCEFMCVCICVFVCVRVCVWLFCGSLCVHVRVTLIQVRPVFRLHPLHELTQLGELLQNKYEPFNSVVDPGFPRSGGANPRGWAPTYDFAKFSAKLHEIERIWTPGGAHPSRPLRSATAIKWCCNFYDGIKNVDKVPFMMASMLMIIALVLGMIVQYLS